MQYEKPEMDIVMFDGEDVITLSNAGEGGGGSEDLFPTGIEG